MKFFVAKKFLQRLQCSKVENYYNFHIYRTSEINKNSKTKCSVGEIKTNIFSMLTGNIVKHSIKSQNILHTKKI